MVSPFFIPWRRNVRGPAGRFTSTTSRAASAATGSAVDLLQTVSGRKRCTSALSIIHPQNHNSGLVGRLVGGGLMATLPTIRSRHCTRSTSILGNRRRTPDGQIKQGGHWGRFRPQGESIRPMGTDCVFASLTLPFRPSWARPYVPRRARVAPP